MAEPIAITGIACRYPRGADSPEGLWRLVDEEICVIDRQPAGRGWPAGAERRYAGGFLDSVADFDAGFFGMPAEEATATDPQQRLLLECVWEALERAGVVPASVRGSRTGVYVGMMYSDYGGVLAAAGTPGDVIGNSPSMATRRIAYSFGFEGPAMTVDTSCSSGVVGAHLACQALRGGECDMAVAAGVTVMSTPAIFEQFDRNGWLAADGKCRPYADDAGGTGFCEGAAVLLLERLADARRAGRPVWAVIRGSAVNQDGATAGIDIPKGPTQQAVIRAALAAGGLGADDIDVVEGNSNGSLLADPIELNALMATYGRARTSAEPLWLGSVKSNLGHAQAAGGLAGIIKMVTAIRHRKLPKTLHADRPSTKVDWSPGTIRVLTSARPWPDPGRPRRAAVSSFGISSTNTHLVLEEFRPAGPEPVARADGGPAVPVTVSAKDPAALTASIERLRAAVAARPGWTAPGIGHALARTRSSFRWRVTFVVRTRGELLDALAAFPGTSPAAAPLPLGRRTRRRVPALVVRPGAVGPAEVADITEGYAALSGTAERGGSGTLAAIWTAAFGSMAAVHAGDGEGGAVTWPPGPVVVLGTRGDDEGMPDGPGRPRVARLDLDPGDGWAALLRGLAGLERQGTEVAWPRLYPADPGVPLDLPTYPFQRERYWPRPAG